MSVSPLIRSAYAGLFATSNAMADKNGVARSPYRPSSRLMLPVALQDVPRLLHDGLDGRVGAGQRAARVTAAAQCKSLDPDRKNRTAYDLDGLAKKLTSSRERSQLQDKKARFLAFPSSLTKAERDRSQQICRYCTVFDELFHDFTLPTIAIVNHSARINLDFSLETNISEASIDNYQLLLPRDRALEALEATHPLFWDEAAQEFFPETSVAVPDGNRPRRKWDILSGKEGRVVDAWEQQARRENYTYEHAVWPWNERLSTQIENILRIRSFIDATTDADYLRQKLRLDPRSPQPVGYAIADLMKPGDNGKSSGQLPIEDQLSGSEPTSSNDRARAMHYEYSLESCLRSSYGIGAEDYSGLNVDDGRVANVALHWSQLSPEYVGHLGVVDLLHLHEELVRQLASRQSTGLEERVEQSARLIRNEGARSQAETNCRVVQWIAETLELVWKEPVWLLSVSSSKRIRFTIPRNGPVELWSALTWMGPSILFSFLNRAVCQLPHFLLAEPKKKRALASTA